MHPKAGVMHPKAGVMHPRGEDGMANSTEPNQTAPLGAV